ncbi:MAG: MFS transporter [Puniceicoccales bacterium]|jgi:MFS family permease|nr:MFS transporter [Puniceicoccales bacterium]
MDHSEIDKHISENRKLAWLVWGAAAFFYFYELFVRVMPGTMLQEMQFHYNVSLTTLSIASGIYYYIYAPMQIFAGILLDRFGGRRIMIPASITVAAGCACILIPWNSIWLFAIGRLLMGFGSAFGFIGVMYLATVWFHKEHLSFLAGTTTALGFLGAILALKFIPYCAKVLNWQNCWLEASLFGLISAAILYKFIPQTPIWEKKRREAHFEEFAPNHAFSGFFSVIRNKQTWLLGLIGGILYMPTTVLGDLWGKEYVETVYYTSKENAGFIISMIYLGWFIGAPFWGFFSDRTGLKRSLLFFSTLSASILLSILILCDKMSLHLLMTCLFFTGFVSAPQVICFLLGIEENAENTKASAIATINMIISLVGGIFQFIVGFILDHLCDNFIKSMPHHYDAQTFKWALFVMPIFTLIGFFLTFSLNKNSNKREQTK